MLKRDRGQEIQKPRVKTKNNIQKTRTTRLQDYKTQDCMTAKLQDLQVYMAFPPTSDNYLSFYL
jgi:hypothetical protein